MKIKHFTTLDDGCLSFTVYEEDLERVIRRLAEKGISAGRSGPIATINVLDVGVSHAQLKETLNDL